MPKGAFLRVPEHYEDRMVFKKLATLLLEQAGRCCFGGDCLRCVCRSYLRFSVVNSLENLNKALARIEDWVGKKS